MQNQKKFIKYLKEEYEIRNADELRTALNKCMDEIVCINSAITSLCDLRAFCDNRTDESCKGCIFYDEDNGCGIDGLPGNWSVPVIDGKHKEGYKEEHKDEYKEKYKEEMPNLWSQWIDEANVKSADNEPVNE